MGPVHAKEAAASSSSDVKSVDEKGNKVDLKNVKARVDTVTVDGLARTKDDYVRGAVRQLFKSQNFHEVIVNSHKVREQLESNGCFKNVGIFIDLSSGPGATQDGVEVIFNVKEQRRLTGGVNTLLGNNEASLLLGLRAPNVFGRGERVEFEYSVGSRKSSNLCLSFVKPVQLFRDLSVKGSIFQQNGEWPESGCSQVERGFQFDLNFTTAEKIKHKIRYEAGWRDLNISSRSAAFEVREDAGHTLKSSIKHSMVVDKRDSVVFPKRGIFVSCSNELAGLGGNIGFVKNDLHFQANFPLLSGLVLQASAQLGTLHPMFHNKTIGISDKYFAGGPLTVRGFRLCGIGPRVDGSSLGACHTWAAGLHLFGPLPFISRSGGFSDLFRVHLFTTVGNSDNFNFSNDYLENLRTLARGYRLSYGCGIAIRLAQIARVEINYAIPVSYQPSDLISPGLQFGVGVNFL